VPFFCCLACTHSSDIDANCNTEIKLKFSIAIIWLHNINQIIPMTLSLKRLLGGIVICAFCTPCSAAESNAPVAEMGTVSITAAQLNDLISMADPEVKQQLKSDPALLTQFVRTELIRQSVLNEALSKQWDKRPEVQKQLQRTRDELLVTSYLNDLSRPPGSYPSEQEVSQAYETSKDSFVRPRRFHLAQIYIADTSASETKESERRARELANQASSEDFVKLATKYSQHAASAAQGGDMGWIDENQLIPAMKEQIEKLKVGGTSQPIRSQAGWHVVKLLESKPAGVAPLTEVREAIVAGLRLARARQMEQDYLVKLLEHRKPSINEKALQDSIK